MPSRLVSGEEFIPNFRWTFRPEFKCMPFLRVLNESTVPLHTVVSALKEKFLINFFRSILEWCVLMGEASLARFAIDLGGNMYRKCWVLFHSLSGSANTSPLRSFATYHMLPFCQQYSSCPEVGSSKLDFDWILESWSLGRSFGKFWQKHTFN